MFQVVYKGCAGTRTATCQQAVQIPTVAVLKFRLHQSCRLGVVYCNEYYRNCTPTVWGTKAPSSLCTQLVAPVQYVHHGGVRVCTAGVHKYCSHKSDLVSEEYRHASFRNPTPTMLGTNESPYLCTKAVWAPVRQRRSASCTDRYSGCTKIPFESDFSPWVVYYHVHFRNCTPTEQGATAPPSSCTRLLASIWHVH